MLYRIVLHCATCEGWTVRAEIADLIRPIYPGTNSHTSPCGHCGQDAALVHLTPLEQEPEPTEV